ncbi:MAG: ABC transporter permease [Sphingobium sp.]
MTRSEATGLTRKQRNLLDETGAKSGNGVDERIRRIGHRNMNDKAGPDHFLIRPRGGLRSIDVQELWHYREVIFFLVWRDFKVRYRQTLLGVVWALIQPALTVAIFALLFSRIAGVEAGGTAYPLFALAGFVPWAFFSFGVGAATGAMINNQDLVMRIYFPRLAIPIAAIFSGLTDMLIGLALLAAAMVYYGQPVGPDLLLTPLFLLQGIAATIGIGLMLSAANARFRDIGHAVPFALQVGLLATPIGYPTSAIPAQWLPVYSLNPMVGVIDGMRASLFDMPLNMESYLISLGVTLVLLVVGTFYFHHVERNLADIL